MAITTSFLTVTPTWENKKLTVEGSASVRESVRLRIVGCGADTSVVFKLSSENGRVDYAKFPNAQTDAWTVDGNDLTGTLNLNTDLLVAAFAVWGPEDRLDFICTVASRTNSNLYALGHKQIGNWMEDTDDPVAYSTPMADEIDQLQDDVGTLEENFATHSHDGASSPRIPHGNLENVGINTHAAIDAALLNLASGIATNASNIANGAVMTLDHEARLDAIESGINAGTLVDLPATADDTDFVDLHASLKSVLDYIAGLKASLT